MRDLKHTIIRATTIASLFLGTTAICSAQQLRPTASGPITVEAKQAEIQRNGLATYSGDVKVDSAEFSIRGEQLELRQPRKGILDAKVVGSPATFSALGDDGTKLNSISDQVHYDGDNRVVLLSGSVTLSRGSDSIRGERIEYDLNQRRIRAQGGVGGQVKIVIDPNANGFAFPSNTPALPPAPPANGSGQ